MLKIALDSLGYRALDALACEQRLKLREKLMEIKKWNERTGSARVGRKITPEEYTELLGLLDEARRAAGLLVVLPDDRAVGGVTGHTP